MNNGRPAKQYVIELHLMAKDEDEYNRFLQELSQRLGKDRFFGSEGRYTGIVIAHPKGGK